MLIHSRLRETLARDGVAVLVTVERTDGSAPRDAGATMVVTTSGAIHGTIGGGALEWEALRLSQTFAADASPSPLHRAFTLGPELAQCCGGRVHLRLERFIAADMERVAMLADRERTAFPPTQLALFGAGHVGRALVLALAPLPFEILWIDERHDVFPAAVPGNVTKVSNSDPAAELDALEPGAFVLVMTHSHARDLDVVTRALTMRRFGYVGLIGSATKRARFEHRMAEAGLSESLRRSLVCPIGLHGLTGKEPAVIAASTAASLLLARECIQSGRKGIPNEQ